MGLAEIKAGLIKKGYSIESLKNKNLKETKPEPKPKKEIKPAIKPKKENEPEVEVEKNEPKVADCSVCGKYPDDCECEDCDCEK